MNLSPVRILILIIDRKKILSFLLIFYFLFLDSIVQSQWFNHKLHVVGKDGLLDLSDQLTDIKDTNIQLEINDWQCEFELLSLESFRLIKEPNKKKGYTNTGINYGILLSNS